MALRDRHKRRTFGRGANLRYMRDIVLAHYPDIAFEAALRGLSPLNYLKSMSHAALHERYTRLIPDQWWGNSAAAPRTP